MEEAPALPEEGSGKRAQTLGNLPKRPQTLEDLPKHSTSPDKEAAASPPKVIIIIIVNYERLVNDYRSHKHSAL